MAVTDSRGRFKLRSVPVGSVSVEAYAADVGRGRVDAIDVTTGRPTTGVSIRLDEPADGAEPASTGSVAVTLGERDYDDGIEVVIVHVCLGQRRRTGGAVVG